MKKVVLILVAMVFFAVCANTNTASAQSDKVSCQQKELVFKNQKSGADSTKLSLPEYEGGLSELRQYLRDNVQYPEALVSSEAEGTCMVQFVVGVDGEVSEVTVAQSSGYPEMDDEAVRVAKGFPNWNPATMNGAAISMKTQVPIHFKYVRAEE